jgi:hypothetical protein
MKKLPSELIFISQINRDGSGTTPLSEKFLKSMAENRLMANEKYKLIQLSMTEGTFIAHGFNAFVVKIR